MAEWVIEPETNPRRDEYPKDLPGLSFACLLCAKRDPMTEVAQDRLYCKLTRNPHTGSKGSLMVYEAVLLRNGEEIQTLYWNGPLQETVNLARTIALKCEADRFRVMRH
jgi:hypothetical protein